MAVRECDICKHPKYLMINDHPCLLTKSFDANPSSKNRAFYVSGTDIFNGGKYSTLMLADDVFEPVVSVETFIVQQVDPLILRHADGRTRDDLQVCEPELLKPFQEVQVLRWGDQECVLD